MIRKAELSDLKQLGALFRQLHELHIRLSPDSFRMPFEGYFELEMRSFIEDENFTVLTEEDNGTLLSYVVLRVYDRERAERTDSRICYIEHFVVGERYRRRGCGTRLFEKVRQFAHYNGCGSIQLGAAAQNSGAVKFYESMGMKPRTIKMEIKL